MERADDHLLLMHGIPTIPAGEDPEQVHADAHADSRYVPGQQHGHEAHAGRTWKYQ